MTDLALATMHRDAEAAFRRQDYLTAASLLGQVLKQDRRDVRARALLAQMAMNTGDFDSAATLLNESIRLAPKNALLRIRLGRVHAAQGGYASAIAQYDRALKLDPSATDAVAAKAEAFERQGRPERALRLLEPLARSGPPPLAVAATFVRCLARTGDLARAIAVGEAATAGADRADGDGASRETLFALARAHEETGAIDAAFAAAARANALLAAPYDPDSEAAAVDELVAAFAPEAVAALPRADVDGTPAVFIVGLPRSGSTLVERILASHPLVHGAGEISAFHLIVARLPEAIGSSRPWPACVRDLGPDQATAQGRAYLDALRALAPRAERTTNKDLGVYRHLGLVPALLPGARVIHCRRAPLDLCLSCYMERLKPSSAPYASDLGHLGRHFLQYERLMAHWRGTLDVPLLEIDYEDVVADQPGATRRLLEFVGLPWDDACLAFHATKRHDRTLSHDQVRRPIYATSVGRADRFADHLGPLRAALGARAGGTG